MSGRYTPVISFSPCAAGSVWKFDAVDQYCDISLPWNHSVLSEGDFLSPYMAILHAQIQRFEVLFSHQQWIQPQANQIPTFSNLKSCLGRRNHQQRCAMKLHFQLDVEVHLGTDAGQTLTKLNLPRKFLGIWENKPWQLWQHDKHGLRVRCAPPSDEAVSSSTLHAKTLCLDSLIPCGRNIISQARITDQHGHVEGLHDGRTHDNEAQHPPMQPADLPICQHLFNIC